MRRNDCSLYLPSCILAARSFSDFLSKRTMSFCWDESWIIISPKGNLSDLISWVVVVGVVLAVAAAAPRDLPLQFAGVGVSGGVFFGNGTLIVIPSPRSIK